ncbi:MAG: 30S ribosomal protein S18 [Lachnospiraceae bacterium]|nr:30S ribosomal protein S18 [Lachnospiraceae bacterium]
MAFAKSDKGERGEAPRKRVIRRKKKVCIFCTETIDSLTLYRDTKVLSRFISERGKILPRRITGTCAKHQRLLTTSVKRARHIALLPYTVE